ncbi:MAG: DUF4197 domain-containing protein [Rhodospirillales bacterium]
MNISRRQAITLLMSSACLASTPVQAQSLLDRARKALGDGTTGSAAPGEADIIKGLKEALRVGSDRVVSRIGTIDGFNANPDIHIPLPPALQKVQSALQAVGLSGMADDLELRLNRAAEAAAPEARQLFWNAVSDMSIDDAQKIYNGPDNAATSYFQGRMTPELREKFTPVVNDSLREVGAVKSYDAMIGKYKSLPFVPDATADLSDHVVTRALDGLFLLLGREEKAIRENPAARSTEILKSVFGR